MKSEPVVQESGRQQQQNTSDDAVAMPSLQHEKLSIGGMRCAACSQLIEFRLRQLEGVSQFQINGALHRADISWDPKKISLRTIIESVATLGYSALPAGSAGARAERESKMSLWRLFVAGFAMMQVMMYAFPAYLEPMPSIDGDLTPDIDRLLKLASLALTLPVVFFSAAPFFQSAWRAVRNRHIGMDLPVSVGILVTFVASIWAIFAGGPVYFDSLIMFVFLLLGARVIEARVHKKSTAALRALTELVPLQADQLPDYPASRETRQVNATQLQVGDFILIPAGAQIPVDGEVVEGLSECDESLMTGESHAVAKTVGAKVIGGAMNLSGTLVMRAERVGDETELSSLVRMMESAANEKPPLVQLADRQASLFLSIILLLALAAGIVWWQIDSSRAVWIAVTVMVITCPCALSLATPGVMSGAIGQLARHGVLVARGRAIETLARATHFVFDKTGTLTQGRLKLAGSHILRQGQVFGTQSIAEFVVQMAAGSLHPVARALVAELSTSGKGSALYPFAGEVQEIAGQGLELRVAGEPYRLGNVNFVAQLHGLPLDIPIDLQDKTLSALGDAHGWIALYGLEDGLRGDAKELVRFLQERGKQVLLLSGDRPDVVAAVAGELQVDSATGGLSPAQKHDVVKQLQQQGAIVAVIGDGMNDGPVLSLADVSIAMGQGAPISQARSDLVLISSRLRDLQYAVRLTATSLSLIRQNLGWAILYNVVAIPAAVSGMLAPWHAAIGMSLSSLIVVLNSLRILSGGKSPEPGDFDENAMLTASMSQPATVDGMRDFDSSQPTM
jgi:P-type Cu2+ transporter